MQRRLHEFSYEPWWDARREPRLLQDALRQTGNSADGSHRVAAIETGGIVDPIELRGVTVKKATSRLHEHRYVVSF